MAKVFTNDEKSSLPFTQGKVEGLKQQMRLIPDYSKAFQLRDSLQILPITEKNIPQFQLLTNSPRQKRDYSFNSINPRGQIYKFAASRHPRAGFAVCKALPDTMTDAEVDKTNQGVTHFEVTHHADQILPHHYLAKSEVDPEQHKTFVKQWNILKDQLEKELLT